MNKVCATLLAVMKLKLSYGECRRTRRMTTAGFHRQILSEYTSFFIGLRQLSAAEQIDHDGNDCQHEKYMDEAAHGVGCQQSQEPQDHENNSDRV